MPRHSSMRLPMLGLAAAILLVACSGAPKPPAAAGTLAPAAAGAQTVVIQSFKFQPATLTVKAGETVEWKNEDIVPHTATAAEVSHTRAFDSSSIAKGGSRKWVASTPGTYDYICTLHPNMKGRVVVQ
jgi:plastocyanin